MRVHSKQKIKNLIKLRSTGYSIQEIMEILDMPKTTVWHHIQGIEVLPQYKALLRSKRGGGSKRKANNIKRAEEEAIKLFTKLNNRDCLIALSMLYWAEGSKGSPEFINSDGRMITLYLHILRKILKIPNDSIHVTVRIFTGMNEKECVYYWSQITNISSKHFTVRMNDGGTRGRTRYGMCRIRVRKGGHFLKMMHSLIDLSFEKMIVQHAPVV